MTETIPFSIIRELSRTVTYTIPSLALLWYLITDKKWISSFESVKPRLKRDLLPFVTAIPGLLIIGLFTMLLSNLFSQSTGMAGPPNLEGPANLAGWVVLVFACLGTGYLEESYFRYYLLTKTEKQVPLAYMRIVLSTLMFASCHIWEGPWGVLNAALAGLLLSMVFLRFRSIHGIAWAHAGYNFFVFVLAAAG